jgi:hypothetical protein
MSAVNFRIATELLERSALLVIESSLMFAISFYDEQGLDLDSPPMGPTPTLSWKERTTITMSRLYGNWIQRGTIRRRRKKVRVRLAEGNMVLFKCSTDCSLHDFWTHRLRPLPSAVRKITDLTTVNARVK